MGIKFDLYQEVGVREYWIINPLEETLLIYVLKDGKYVGERPYARGEIATASSVIFPELIFDLDKIQALIRIHFFLLSSHSIHTLTFSG